MKLVGLMLARNEDWVIGLSAPAALMWCDALVVMMHRCRDETASIVNQIWQQVGDDRIRVLLDESEHWEEMRLRNEMLNEARYHLGASHLALIDADEVLTGNSFPLLPAAIESLSPGVCLQVPWLQLAGDSPSVSCRGQYITSGLWSQQNAVVAFRDDPRIHWAARDGGYDFHHRHPMGVPFKALSVFEGNRAAGLMHLQFLSRRRLLAKQFLYQLIERLRWPAREDISVVVNRYARTVYQWDRATVSACPESWWAPYAHLIQYLDVGRAPWQESECIRLLQLNPGLHLGLDDFGLMAQWKGCFK